jgi:hypothetical protein
VSNHPNFKESCKIGALRTHQHFEVGSFDVKVQMRFGQELLLAHHAVGVGVDNHLDYLVYLK